MSSLKRRSLDEKRFEVPNGNCFATIGDEHRGKSSALDKSGTFLCAGNECCLRMNLSPCRMRCDNGDRCETTLRWLRCCGVKEVMCFAARRRPCTPQSRTCRHRSIAKTENCEIFARMKWIVNDNWPASAFGSRTSNPNVAAKVETRSAHAVFRDLREETVGGVTLADSP